MLVYKNLQKRCEQEMEQENLQKTCEQIFNLMFQFLSFMEQDGARDSFLF